MDPRSNRPGARLVVPLGVGGALLVAAASSLDAGQLAGLGAVTILLLVVQLCLVTVADHPRSEQVVSLLGLIFSLGWLAGHADLDVTLVLAAHDLRVQLWPDHAPWLPKVILAATFAGSLWLWRRDQRPAPRRGRAHALVAAAAPPLSLVAVLVLIELARRQIETGVLA